MDYLWANVRLGHLELSAGNLTEALRIFGYTAQEFLKDGNSIGVVVSLEGMTGLYIAVGEPDHAGRLIGWVDATREGIGGSTRPFLEQAEVDRNIAAVVTKIGKVAFEEAYNNGSTMTLDEAVAYALDG